MFFSYFVVSFAVLVTIKYIDCENWKFGDWVGSFSIAFLAAAGVDFVPRTFSLLSEGGVTTGEMTGRWVTVVLAYLSLTIVLTGIFRIAVRGLRICR